MIYEETELELTAVYLQTTSYENLFVEYGL